MAGFPLGSSSAFLLTYQTRHEIKPTLHIYANQLTYHTYVVITKLLRHLLN